MELGGPSNFPIAIIWNSWVLPKVSFFAWEATWSKVLTLDLVRKRGWSMENKCFLCHEEQESIDHVLIHCDKTRFAWHILFSLFGVSWVLPSSMRELLLSWHGSFVGRKRKKVWQAIPLCLLWTIWKERNNRALDNKELSVQGIELIFSCNLWAWSKLFIVSGLSSIVNFVDWLGAL